MSRYPYIVTPYQAALEAGLITEDTTRRVNNDKTKVILNSQDFATYKPLIKETAKVQDPITLEETETEVERFADSLEEKARNIGATIMTHSEILQEIQKQEWINDREE